jgi:hypothetical protein
MTFAHPQYLVDTDWLEAHLTDPDLHVLDCTVFFQTEADGVRVNNGCEAWAQGHIPGSGFADLMQDLSDRDSRLPFMMPPAAQFAEAWKISSMIPGWCAGCPPWPGRQASKSLPCRAMASSKPSNRV